MGQACLGTHLCSTRALADSRLKERTAPLLKPQKKVGCVGWKATARGASSGDVKSYSCGGGMLGQTAGPREPVSPGGWNLRPQTRAEEPRAHPPGLSMACGFQIALPAGAPLATPHLLQGRQVPDAHGAVLGHSGQLSPAALGGKGQHRGGVGAHKHAILLGRDVQEAQVTRGCGGQHTQAAGADADGGDWPLVLCRQGAW